MKASYSVKWILIGAMLMPGLTACSFFGSEEQPAEVAANGEEGAAEANNAEANAEENSEASDPTADVAENDAEIPPAPEAEIPMGNEDPGNTANLGGDSAAPPADLLGTNAAESNGLGAPPPEALAAPEAAPAPSAPPSGDVRVYYVSIGSLPLRDKPDGQTVGQLKMGDPVLVIIEGNWANVLNRGYVELASLSMGPIARAKDTSSWN